MMSISRLSATAAAALLPACLRVGAFVLPVTSTTRFMSKESDDSSCSSRWAASNRGTSAAASVEEAKSNLMRVLVDNKGSTLAKDVVAAVEVGVCVFTKSMYLVCAGQSNFHVP